MKVYFQMEREPKMFNWSSNLVPGPGQYSAFLTSIFHYFQLPSHANIDINLILLTRTVSNILKRSLTSLSDIIEVKAKHFVKYVRERA